MSLLEFLEWTEGREERHELASGEVYAMSRESVEHARLKASVWLALRSAIRKAGLPCEAIIDGPGVIIEDHSYFVPDVIVICGDRLDGGVSLIDDPVVVVEVLSPSTKVFDVEEKLVYYFAKTSIQHYLIVAGKSRYIVHHRRTGAAKAETEIVGEGEITLDPPGLTFAVADCFADFRPSAG
ncbi:MAG: Uma2 family endonuclease [Hyphomicrobiales bacterium]|nr:Uma2 family endonuclease [Hyphomicrobiales bacterium]